MARHTQHTVIRSILALVSALALVVGLSSPASAGGWAVASLDEMPTPTAGETTEIGFRILQHGETPVDLTEDVGIEIIGADGTTTFFPAVLDGPTGHYVASVTFPDAAGSYSWAVRMGWFGPQALGSIDVSSPVDHSSGSSAWSVARWSMLGVGLVLAAIAVADFVSGRRRGRVALG